MLDYIILHHCNADSCCLCLYIHFRLFSHSFIIHLFSLDDAKTALLSLARVHITKDHIPQHSLLTIQAQTYTRLIFPLCSSQHRQERERAYKRKVNTPTRTDAVRKNLDDYT
jgi:hypothetical protein